jgi:hypothetical protein
MNALFRHMRENPVDLTYFAIGSSFRTYKFEELTPMLDQVFPCFLRDFEGSSRAIHYDPEFAKHYIFINEYFERKGCLKSKSKNNMWISRNGRFEFIIFTEEFHYSLDCFKELALTCLPNKLIIQDFTGKPLNDVCIQTYYSIAPELRDMYKRKVLIDMTYGDSSCMTNMEETYPILDSQGDFVNFLLIKHDELVEYINQNKKLDILINTVFKKEFKKVLNEHHTNYRRRMQSNSCLFSRTEYDLMADPEVIFNVMVQELQALTKVLSHFNFPQEQFDGYVKNYKNYDMYKWYTAVNNLPKDLQG